jgi:topoisomerase IA-like protein
VKYGAVNVTIPKGTNIEEVKLEQVAQWAAEKIARDGDNPPRKRATRASRNGRPPAAPKEAKPSSPKKKAPPKKKAKSKPAKRPKKAKRRKGKSD